jgi:hypothetical protein
MLAMLGLLLYYHKEKAQTKWRMEGFKEFIVVQYEVVRKMTTSL